MSGSHDKMLVFELRFEAYDKRFAGDEGKLEEFVKTYVRPVRRIGTKIRSGPVRGLGSVSH